MMLMEEYMSKEKHICPKCKTELNYTPEKGGAQYCEFCGANLFEKDTPVIPSQSGAKSLFGVVEWLNDKPFLNGMKYFETKKECLDYIDGIPRFDGLKADYTIIMLEKGI